MTVIKSRLLKPMFCSSSGTEIPNVPFACFEKHSVFNSYTWKGTSYLCKQMFMYMGITCTCFTYAKAGEASCKRTCLYSHRSLAAVELNSMWFNLSCFEAAWQLLAPTLVYLWLAWGRTCCMTVGSTGIYPYSVFKHGSSCYSDVSWLSLREAVMWIACCGIYIAVLKCYVISLD